MRKQRFQWALMVFEIIGVAYGGYSLIYNQVHGDPLPVLGLVLLILGILCLAFSIAWLIAIHFANKKRDQQNPLPSEPEVAEAPAAQEVEPTKPEPKPSEDPKPETRREQPSSAPQRERVSRSTSSSFSSTVYVKRVGYGPVLRIEGSRVLDMRSNTYYRIEDNTVMQEGYGIRYEIRGSQIKDAFGGYQYELSGSNINKVFGGFYASISGNYITLYDLSEKYEMTDSLSKKQILVACALLFGRY